MNNAINDIFNGKDILRIDQKKGIQTIFQGKGNEAQARCKGTFEREVIFDENNLRILTK